MKKLVPAGRANISRTTAASRMPKARRIRMDVTNHDQQVSGMRSHVMPGARWRIVVATKPTALISEDKQKRPILTSQRSVPTPCPGPADAKALSGGYCVQPAPDAPPGTKNAAIKTKNESSAVQNPAAVSRGKAIFEAPNSSGRKN